MAKEKAALLPVVAAKFDIVGDWSRCHFFGHFGEVDFNTLSVDRAASLVNSGFPYLKEKTIEIIAIDEAPFSIDSERTEFVPKFDSKKRL